ncbi:MAG: pilus assembly protein N-terminal domain-containing protein, partial [Candidatus Eremiobacteraeota bacterium]|nr:pilus assembly protein N-terminal domain-containing protein [Candidatus Eremiobacteraeota bacterium]
MLRIRSIQRFAMIAALMTAAIACFTGRAAASPAIERASVLSLQSGHSVVLTTPGLSRVAVGDGRIAGVVPVGASQLVVNGKAPGRTTIFGWMTSGRRSYDVTVTQQLANDLASMIRTSIDEPDVQVVSFDRSVVVRGIVADGAHFQMLSDVLGRFDRFAQQQKDVIVNAVRVAHPLGDMQKSVASIPGAHDIRVDPDGKGNVIVSGMVADATTEQAVLARAKGLAGPYLASDGKLIDRLSAEHTSQIDVKVYVLEIDHTGLKNLGVELQSAVPDPNNPNNLLLGPPSFPIFEDCQACFNGKALNVGAFFRTVRLAPTLNALIQDGHARILSSPNLVTLPGTQATFLVGGEIPYAFSTGLGQVSVAFKNYGVQLDVTPQLTPDGSV